MCGEGGGLLVLESLEHARRRDARIYAEVVGYGMTGDAHHMTAPDPEGDGAARSMAAALHDAGARALGGGLHQCPRNVDAVQRQVRDPRHQARLRRARTEARRVLHEVDDRAPPGRGGGIEAIATAFALHHGMLPPTINYEKPDPDCDLDYVPNQARKQEVEVALSNAFGFGGTNATLAFRKFRG